MANIERTRFRSFAERYVVERARFFAVGKEVEDGWKAALDAKTIYKQINSVSEGFDDNATKQ